MGNMTLTYEDRKLLMELCSVDMHRCELMKKRVMRDFKGGGDIVKGIDQRINRVARIAIKVGTRTDEADG